MVDTEDDATFEQIDALIIKKGVYIDQKERGYDSGAQVSYVVFEMSYQWYDYRSNIDPYFDPYFGPMDRRYSIEIILPYLDLFDPLDLISIKDRSIFRSISGMIICYVKII